MRRNPTPSEQELWAHLRRKQTGWRFRRQAVILGWIADFYCPALRLVIEVDGASHLDRKSQDATRDEVMQRHGFTVLRVKPQTAVQDVLAYLIREGKEPSPAAGA